MLSKEDNALLTRIGPGTPMGRLMREYWIPVLISTELPERDGPPLRVRVLGENLVAFRDSNGRVGLVEEACPHRGASLYFARNEEGGLRCAYHGWKFDVDGTCLDLPNELPTCPLRNSVRLTAYPCRERNGIVWSYLGPRDEPPALPDLEWNLGADNVPFLWRNYRACNWMQALEGDLDSSHINFLHRTLDDDRSTVPGVPLPGYAAAGIRMVQADPSPRLSVRDTAVGAVYSAARRVDEERDYHRVHPFLFPFHTMVGGGTRADEVSFNGKAWIPMDDEHTLALEWQFRPHRPWTDDERESLRKARIPWGFHPADSRPGGAWRPAANAANEYMRDRSLETSRLFCGILSNPLQDAAVQESMGPTVDRSREHLGPADAMIVRVRRRLLEAARALRDHGISPPGVDDPEGYRTRPMGMLLPRGADWFEAFEAGVSRSRERA